MCRSDYLTDTWVEEDWEGGGGAGGLRDKSVEVGITALLDPLSSRSLDFSAATTFSFVNGTCILL